MQHGERELNVGKLERWLSTAAGGVCVLLAIPRRSLLLAGAGAMLLARGLRGHSRLYARLGINTTSSRRHEPAGALRRPDQERKWGNGTRDMVEEASWESFPASDPPGYAEP
jgi:uncharacterized membrane protein